MKTKKARSASKPTNSMNLLRGAIGQKNSNPLRVALDSFKTDGPVDNFNLAYLLASSSPHFGGVFTAARRTSKQAVLGVARPLKVASLAREVQWAAVAIYFRRDTLNTFVKYREKFFSAFFAGNFDVAGEILDSIIDDCGHSCWELENRIALLTVSGGFEKQKKYVQQLTKERGRSNVSFLARNFGERNEPRVTATAFQQQFRNRAKTWKVDEETASYLSYKLTNRVESSELAYASVLAHEGTWSVVDLYESLLDVLRRSKTEKFFDAATSVRALDYLEVTDWRISRLRAYLGDEEPIEEHTTRNLSITLFNEGRIREAADTAKSEVEANPHDLTAIRTHAKAHSAIGTDAIRLDGWLASSVENALHSIYTRADDTAQAADELVKLSINLRHSDFSEELILPIAELSERGITERRKLIRSASVYRPVLCHTAFDGTTAWTADAHAYYAALEAIARHDWEGALRDVTALAGSSLEYYRTVSGYLSAHLSERLLQVGDALEKAVALYIENPASLLFTPLLQIIRPHTFRDLKSMEGNAALACAFYIYSQHTGRTDKEVSLKVAWKKFLASRSADRPSSLLNSKAVPLSEQEIFFLSQVCHQETMELGDAFSTQMDLDRERMKICIGLTQIDSHNLESYDQEIVDLTRRINIEEGVQYLESSRVFVDEIGILSWAKKNLQSQFLRYKDYLRAGMFSSARELESRILKIAATSRNRKLALESYLDDYDVSAESLLEEIVVRLGDAFLSRPRFGLDAFLSSRVRHGSFVGYLRGPLELKHFVTKKNSSTGKYFENKLILDQWGIHAHKERNSVNGKLVNFSAYVDELLDEAVSKYLHVRSKSRPDGMVSFTAELGSEGVTIKRWLLLLKSTIDEHSTLDELVRHCFQNLFWPSVKLSLDRLQAYVKSELGNDLTYAIDKLADEVRPHLNDSNRTLLVRDRYYAKLEIKTAIDRVAQWFDAPKENTQMLRMAFPRAIEIGLQSTKNARPNFNPNVKWSIDRYATMEVYGPAIGIVNDIAFLIFANVSKHSGFEEADSNERIGPSIEVIIGVAGDAIEMTVRSEISPRKDLDEVRKGVESARSKIARRDFDSVIQSSSGTGLVRLAIMCGGAVGEALEFGLDEDIGRTFFVRILIARGVIEPIRRIELSA
ncbi:hypothetical protein [Paraburkholderia strydomiana]|uniref:hypothetical protein n=1 Tax=Paraburkholderia strydomiana TaxID=1245417 RepID=UPI0038BD10F0